MFSKWQMPTALKCQLAKSSRSYGGMQLSIKNKLNQINHLPTSTCFFGWTIPAHSSDQRGQKGEGHCRYFSFINSAHDGTITQELFCLHTLNKQEEKLRKTAALLFIRDLWLPSGACFLNCSSKIVVDDVTSFICAKTNEQFAALFLVHNDIECLDLALVCVDFQTQTLQSKK
jgi:hypothetical protein